MKKSIYSLLTGVLAVAVISMTSCGEDDTLPPIDGYNNSNEVANANLVAHWDFETNNNERISGTAPANTFGGISSTDGQIGKGLALAEGAIVYPPIAAINTTDALNNYTVSMWINIDNNGSAFSTLFGIFPTANTDFWGNLSLSVETGWFPERAEGDTLVLKTNYLSLNSDGSLNGQDNRPDPRGNPPVGVFKESGRWAHFVVRFNASTHMLEIFGNGTSIGAYSDRGANTTELKMRVPAQAVIGSLATEEIGFSQAPQRPGWQVLATALVDDIRVYNTPLSQAEITALYNLGVAGR